MMNPMIDSFPIPTRRGRKYDDALEGARVVFMRDGFEGASVDNIARAAGVSKATLYSYFPHKTHMFMAVLEQEFARHSTAIQDVLHMDAPVHEVLYAQCRFFVDFLLSDWALEIFRVVTAESGRFPELGHQFYQAGPAQMLGALEQFLSSPLIASQFDIDDPRMAAEQLKMLCHTDLFLKRMFGLMGPPSDEEIDRVAMDAVETFMARFGKPGIRQAAE